MTDVEGGPQNIGTRPTDIPFADDEETAALNGNRASTENGGETANGGNKAEMTRQNGGPPLKKSDLRSRPPLVSKWGALREGEAKTRLQVMIFP